MVPSTHCEKSSSLRWPRRTSTIFCCRCRLSQKAIVVCLICGGVLRKGRPRFYGRVSSQEADCQPQPVCVTESASDTESIACGLVRVASLLSQTAAMALSTLYAHSVGHVICVGDMGVAASESGNLLLGTG